MANFALPAEDGDFGTTATASMPAAGAFVCLTEYVPGNGLAPGRGLFAARGLPRRLRRADFSPHTLLLAKPGQLGAQLFLTVEGRPFCLYVVLGRRASAGRGLADVNRTLRSLAVHARGQGS